MIQIVRTVAGPPKPPTRLGWPLVAILPLTNDDVPGAEWEDYVVDGLGRFRGAAVEVEGGFAYGLQCCLEESAPAGMEAYAFVAPSRLPEALDALLRAAGLAKADLVWVNPEAC